MRVMFDVDGVIRNFVAELEDRLYRTYQRRIVPVAPTRWDFISQAGAELGLSSEEMCDLVFEKWGWELMALAEPYVGAKTAVDLVREAGHRVIFATDQKSEPARRGTFYWCHNYEIVPDELIFTGLKLEANADYYVDDRQETLELLAERAPLVRRDAVVVGVKRPWNRPERLPEIVWVTNPLDYAKLIVGDGKEG